MAQIDLTGTGAAYIRVSEPTQDPRRQRTAIQGWLERHAIAIPAQNWFEDIGWTRDKADIRPDFQRLIKAAEAGQINWIIVDAHDRFGTTDKYQLFSYLHRLREAGCRLFTIDDEEMTSDDFAASINVLLKGEESEKERRTKAQRVLGAMCELAKRGEWNGGYIPFGFEVVCFGANEMKERWRVRVRGHHLRFKISPDGNSVKEYHGRRNFPAKENDEVLQLRPTTEAGHLEVVHEIFERFANESVNFNQIASGLNARGAPTPCYSPRWEYSHVRDLLQNPAYIGFPSWNKNTHGKFSMFKGNRQHRRKPGMKQQPHPKEDWVKPSQPLFKPIIDPDLFERVQVKLASKPVKARAPKSHALWLAGIVYCAKCQQPMNGKIAVSKRKQKVATYICSTYVRASKPRANCSCQVNSVRQDLIEEYLVQYLRDAGHQLHDLVGAATKMDRKTQPNALKEVIKRAAKAYAEMRERVGAELVLSRCPETGTEWWLLHLDEQLGPADDTDRLESLYRSLFSDEQKDLEFRLDDLVVEQEEQLGLLRKLPEDATRAVARVRARLSAIDAEMAETEAKLVNAADEFEAAQRDCQRLGAEWEAAKSALQTEAGARAKAEAVRKVIDRIVLTFRPTGVTRPTSELIAVEFVPVNPQHRFGSLQPATPSRTGSISGQTTDSPSP